MANKNYIQYRMFKQSKKQQQPFQPQLSLNLNKTVKSPQNMPKDILQFLARQINSLKDISKSVRQAHPEITEDRLNQCIHLLEKKIAFSLSQNAEEYHDYIQDFYENSIGKLRAELNHKLTECEAIKRQKQHIKMSYQLLLKEKEHHGDASQVSKSPRSVIEEIEINAQLKKQLDHCRTLLEENSSFILQQAKVIEGLSQQVKEKEKEFKSMREKYEQKVISFDQYIDKNQAEAQQLLKQLAQQQKLYQNQLKELSLLKIRMNEEKRSLEKQLETKMQEIQLLTKKILEDEIMLGKFQRSLTLKQKLTEELYQEISTLNDALGRIGRKEGDFQRVFLEKGEEIARLEERIKLINQTNEKLQNKIRGLNNKQEQLQKQGEEQAKKNAELQSEAQTYHRQRQDLIKRVQILDASLGKLIKQKQNCEKEVKLLQQRYAELYQRTKDQKMNVKQEIMTEVNELVALVQEKEAIIVKLQRKREEMRVELEQELQSRKLIEASSQKMNDLLVELQRRMKYIEEENISLLQSKNILEAELVRVNDKASTQQKLHQGLKEQTSRLKLANQTLNLELQKIKNISQDDPSDCSQLTELRKKVKQIEAILTAQRLEYKESLNKRDFQIREAESKVKILQQQLRDTTKLHENQKFRMGLKIKQLEDLLKERYDSSSRLSNFSENGL